MALHFVVNFQQVRLLHRSEADYWDQEKAHFRVVLRNLELLIDYE